MVSSAVGMKSAFNLSPGQQVVLAGYTLLFRASGSEAKGTTPVKKRGSRCGGMKTHWQPAA